MAAFPYFSFLLVVAAVNVALCPDCPQDYLTGLTLHLDSLSGSGELASGDSFSGNVLIHPTDKIGAGCKIGPNVSIGEGCVVGDGARVANSTIFKGAQIKDHAFVCGR